MCPPPPAGDAPFSWPPSATDLDRVEVLDVTQSLVGPAGVPPSPSRPVPRARLHRPRAHPWARASTVPSARTREGWLLLASGVLIGATLPGLGQMRPTALAHEPHATPTTASASSEGALLRAMQVLLRGERADPPAPAPPPRPSTPAPAPVPASASGVRPASLSGEALPAVHREVRPEIRTRPTRQAAWSPPRQPVTRRATRPVAVRADDGELPIRRVLHAYERAWSRMDAGATRALWPSADPSLLQAAFTPVSEQRLQLAACDVGMSGDRAVAICLGTLRYRPRNSARAAGVERGRWEFDLQRSPDGWRITAVDRP